MNEHASPAASGARSAMRGRVSLSRRTLLIGAGIIALALVLVFGGDSWISVLDVTIIAALVTLALNVLSGYAGQISLGIAFFMGIGAYAAAWLGGSAPQFPGDPAGLNLPFFIWLPAAGIAAGLVGMLIGPSALRLKGFYLSIVTLALIFIGQYLFNNLRFITGGPQGRAMPAPSIGDFSFSDPPYILGIEVTKNQVYLIFLLVILVLAALFVHNVARSRAGRAWQAVRDNEVGASIMGVDLFSVKMGAFVFSSFLAGIAGALWASYFSYADPTTWSLVLSIQFIAAMLIGGVASVWGSILGAAFVFAVPTALEQFSLLPQGTGSGGISSGDLSTIFYGLLIVIFVIFEPAGLVGLGRHIQGLIQRSLAARKGGDSSPTLAPTSSQPATQPTTRSTSQSPQSSQASQSSIDVELT